MTDGLPSGATRKRLLRWGGLAVILVSCAYLVRSLMRLDLAQAFTQIGTAGWLLTALASLAYAISLALLAMGWMRLAASDRQFGLLRVLATYGPGTVAKYFPGSILQYASRQLLGAQIGIGHGSMVRSSLFEAGLHVALALTVAGVLLAGAQLYGLLALAGVSTVLCAWRGSALAHAAGLQGLFFTIFAAMIAGLGGFAIGAEAPYQLAGIYLLAWLAGFLVPIAPGGIGVREAALMALGAPYATPETLALLAIVVRVVGIAGDGIFGLASYGCGALLSAREKAQASG